MAALDRLNDIVGQYESKSDAPARPMREVGPAKLMQHAHVKQDDEVHFSGQNKRPQYKEYVGQVGGSSKDRNAERTTITAQHDGRQDSSAADGQTQILKTQAIATQKQSGMLAEQTGLMHDQIQATQQVSDVVKRLAEYLKAEANKPVPKIQNTGNTYEGEYSRVNEKQLAAQNRRNSITDELRDMRRDRARKMPRDARGRFERKPSVRTGPRIQTIGGGGGGMGGRLMGMGGRLLGMGAIGPLLALATAFYGGKAISAASENYDYDRKNAGAITHGWQSTKDYVGDKFRRDDPGDQVLDRMTASTKKEGQGIGQKAMYSDFGSISGAFESGGKGVGTISSGKNDPGGVSYGKHQLSSDKGSMTNFLRSEEGSKYYNEFRGMQPGSAEFSNKYKEVAGRDGEGMEKAQTAFIKKENYDPVAKWFTEQYDVDLEQRSRALKEIVFSIGTQYGPGTGKRVISDALGNRDITKMDDADIISRLQDTRAATVGTRFKSSKKSEQDTIYRRAGTEKAAALAMLNEERGGAGSAQQVGSGIGSQYSGKMMGAYGGKSPTEQGGSSNGTVGIMAMPQGGGGGSNPATGGDEQGGGTAAAMMSPADGAMYAVGQKHTIPNGSDVNIAGLNPKFKQAWFTMVGDWVTNNGGGNVSVASAFRTRMEQEQLWVKYGRNTKRVARPGTSRHESGFAIDIDRKSAQALETTGMFKKYGFHRPLSNEPWHVEMVGAGKGGAAGGGGNTPAGASPQLMQNAAAQEMDKSAEVVVKSAEENTKGAIKSEGAAAPATGAEAEVKTSPSAEKGGEQAGAAISAMKAPVGPNAHAGAGPVGNGGKSPTELDKSVTPPTVDAMGEKAVTRTPEQQALYEQYLKSSGGDPRAVPESVANPGQAQGTDWNKRADVWRSGGADVTGINRSVEGIHTSTATMPQGASNKPGMYPIPSGGGNYGGGGGYGQRASRSDPTTRTITDTTTRIGGIYGMGSFGSMAPGADKALRGIDSKVGGFLNKNPVLGELARIPGMPQIPRLASGLPSFGNIVNGIADVTTGFFKGDKGPSDTGVTPYQKPAPVMGGGLRATPTGGYVTSTADMSPAAQMVAPTSPASPSYYANETPIMTKSAATPAMAMSAVSATPVAAEATRNSYDGVQKVAMVAPADGGAPSAAPSSGGSGSGAGGGGSGDKNDMPQLEDFPAMIDDLGLLFINSGYV